MNRRLNFDKAFKRFRQNLQISDRQNSALTDTRRTVRKHLRQHCPEKLGIKFLTQGSYAYGTLNRPNQVPPQRMDLDDGTYFTGLDAGDPRKLFEWVDNTLQGLVSAYHGWRLDTNKPSCCRLIIPGDMHIDIPLYASLNETPDNLRVHQEKYAPLYQEAGILYVPLSGVWLAHRSEGWIKSDPRAVIDWVLECKKKYGRQYLSVCRYFKAWRDHQWEDSPLKSILIMRMVELACKQELHKLGANNDDLVVMRVAGRMIDSLGNGGITDPTDTSKTLDAGISPVKQNITAKLESLHGDMEKALCGTIDQKQAYSLIRNQFGKWFPENHGDLISRARAGVAVASAPSTVVSAPRPWAVPWK
ncbi:MAG: CBASS cGAMP synthase [Gammaproteobacteria bacterium]|nr:CBASS cGAMP synthase [Gammaproteobacteria bacterium]